MGAFIPIFAIAVLVACLVYVVLLIVSLVRGYVMASRGHAQEREALRARIAQLADPMSALVAGKRNFAWSGLRKFVLQGKVLECEGVCSFYFAPHDGQPLPPFLPGQYLTFQLNIPGVAKPVTRCYSLSDSPNHPDYYRVTVKRIPPPRDSPEVGSGLVSSYYHQQLQSGDIVDVKAPAGHFFLDLEHHGPIVLIGGGIGLTPVLSMVNHVVAKASAREVWVFYGVRNGSEHVMKDYLKQIANEHENVRLHVCYSDPSPTDVAGQDYQHAERVSVDLFKRLLPSNNYDFYICGPAPMMDTVTTDLTDWGVPKSKVHFEAFGPATVKRVGHTHQETVGASGIKITFAKSGKEILWDGTSDSLLDFAESNNIEMNSGCRAGNCGTCITAIRAGGVEYLNEPGAPVEEGSCLTCISIPKSPITLDA